jgi:Acetyltransferase (GNAT) domain
MLVAARPVESAIKEPDCPVYAQDWFIEIAGADGRFTRRLVAWEGGEQVGSLVYALHRNGIGMKQGYNLPWARLCEPRIAMHLSEARRAQIAHELIKRLPSNASYFLTLSSESDCRLFLQHGFLPAFTENYVIPPDIPSVLFASFSSMTKRHIKHAERKLKVSTTTPDIFIREYEANLRLRRRKPYAPLAVATDLLSEAIQRGQARILTAQREDGEIEAAIACLWDNTRCYYWMTTRRIESDGKGKVNQGAVKLLIWRALQEAAAKGLIFDFDGVPSDYSQKAQRASLIYQGMGAQRSVSYDVVRKTGLERLTGPLREPLKRLILKTLGRFVTLKMNY